MAVPRTPAATMTASTALSLDSHMECRTPWVSVATGARTAPDPNVPAANRAAVATVLDTTDAGTVADASYCTRPAASDAPDRLTPRRESRLASTARARHSQPATVPAGTPSYRAAWARVLPSRSHSRTTARK